jgi:hypothetical protein
MEYFAGIFDADGYVSLIPNGHFVIGLEKHNEQIIQLLQQTFGGHIYKRKRKNKKITFAWNLATDRNSVLEFINKIKDFTHVKTNQLHKLQEYLNLSRDLRRINRSEYSADIAGFKHPISYTRDQINVPTTIKPDESFFKWFAGFMDGDGNFTVFEYQNGIQRSFDSWIGAFNTFGEPIIYIKKHIDGSISQYKGIKFPIWKWVCNQKTSIFVCESLYPYLINRKEQCRLVGEYLKIHAAKIKGIDYSDHDVLIIRDIIKQIKNHNSL